MKYVWIIGLVWIIGCGENNDIKNAHLLYDPAQKNLAPETSKNEKMVLDKMKYQNSIELAKIEAQKAKELEQIALEKAKVEMDTQKEINVKSQQTQKEIALAKEERIALTKDKDNALYEKTLIVLSVLIGLGLLIFLWIYRKNRNDKLKMHEETLKHDAFMQASRQQHETMHKMLEIIVDEKTDRTVKKEIVKLLKDQGSVTPLLEHH